MPTARLPRHRCRRCGHRWTPRKRATPRICPACKRATWNVPAPKGRP